jgi:lipoyl(octanoyl) transferase
MGAGGKRIEARRATISSVSPEVLVVRWGTVPYEEALVAQRWLREARQEGELPDVLLLLEHPPVYTRGRRTTAEELPMSPEWYEMQGIEVCDTERGGRVTYHGPGQLVAYPIVSLRPYGDDVHEYVRRLERVAVETLADHGVEAMTIEGLTGVWTSAEEPRKIGSIGVHVSRGVAAHGLAINVNNDLQPFEWIVPCGIEGCRVTSLSRELAAAQDLDRFTAGLVSHFAEIFERRPVATAPEALGLDSARLGVP